MVNSFALFVALQAFFLHTFLHAASTRILTLESVSNHSISSPPSSSGVPSLTKQPPSTYNLTFLSVIRCNAESYDYLQSSSDYDTEHWTVYSSGQEIYQSSSHIYSNCSGPFTTLCDGITRAMCRTMTTYTRWTTDSVSATRNVTIFPNPKSFTQQRPTCSINSYDCNLVQSAYTSYTNALSNRSTASDLVSVAPAACQSYNPCQLGIPCFVEPGDVRLMYWPVSTADGNVCNQTGHTLFGTPTIVGQPNTVMWEGTTVLTSPTVYLSFSKVYERNGCGSTYTNVIYPVNASRLNSIKGDIVNRNFKSFNFADMFTSTLGNGLILPQVPLAAYVSGGNSDCRWNDTTHCTIYPEYKPQILLDIDLQGLDPLWKTKGCKIGYPWYGVLDPPTALGTVAALFTPTPTKFSSATQVTPKPAPTPTTPIPSVTPAPQITKPPDNSDPAKPTTGGENDPSDDDPAGNVPQNNDPWNGSSAKGSAHRTDPSNGGPILSVKPGSDGAIGSDLTPQGQEDGSISVRPAATITADGQIFTISAGFDSGVVIINGQTMQLGGFVTTFSGVSVSIGLDHVVIGPSTISFAPAATTPRPARGGTFTVGGQVITVFNSHSLAIVNGITLSPGGAAMMLAGTVISAADSGIVVGPSTIPYSVLPSTSPTLGIGGLIISGLGSNVTTNNPATPSQSSNSGVSKRIDILGSTALMFIVLGEMLLQIRR